MLSMGERLIDVREDFLGRAHRAIDQNLRQLIFGRGEEIPCQRPDKLNSARHPKTQTLAVAQTESLEGSPCRAIFRQRDLARHL